MAIYKNDNGTWYVMIRYQDWTGARKQKCKRGFSTRKEAADWELQFKLQKKASVDMTMESFCTMYEEDVRPSLKQSTWLTKEFKFHLFKFSYSKYKVTRCNLITKTLTYLSNTKWKFKSHTSLNIHKINKYSLCCFRS